MARSKTTPLSGTLVRYLRSGAMMLDWLGETHGSTQVQAAARAIEAAVAATLADRRHHTADLGGPAAGAGSAIVGALGGPG